MTKETLTIQGIRYDLWHRIRLGMIAVGVCVAFFLFFFWLFMMALGVNGRSLLNQNFIIFCYCFFTAIPVVFLIAAIVYVVKVYKLYSVWKRPGEVVKDRLVGKEMKDYLVRYNYGKSYYLYFASYGKYKILMDSYGWSELFYLSDGAVYGYAEYGDEFYLVLSKPHTGKILLAYNAKMFDYQPPQ